ncbi:molybdate ABC transporter substrate-binding protein [[Mycobacterium] burgundiense]|uniref:Molybdate ABC transporter substrate-binding protein n=1 Tax=[Mycobacterium] burgundiense TaxID=3064286 RepID=A0ABM9M611_9MYCO|nr:molybdate ABC transporter substrate-binding protein [Mycolicibacterium sp. MU0053]CAJ1510618.1 molybdate ABC transporter substrate-binding protein [Mycolicibacterium sp. MU0053]
MRTRGWAAIGAVVVALTGCGAAPRGSDDVLTVFAAASLHAAFSEIGAQFETAHPGAMVEFSFAGSSTLATQLVEGAPADVFASADARNMAKVVDAGLVGGAPVDFAANTLTIVVAAGNPKSVSTFRDLSGPGLTVVTCAPVVPCGAATATATAAVGVELDPVSEESSVADVLNKVTSGQADAGIVYVTDALGAGDRVTEVPFPAAAAAPTTYPIAPLAGAAKPELAQRFVDYVTGAPGQRVLADHGFAPAPTT